MPWPGPGRVTRARSASRAPQSGPVLLDFRVQVTCLEYAGPVQLPRTDWMLTVQTLAALSSGMLAVSDCVREVVVTTVSGLPGVREYVWGAPEGPVSVKPVTSIRTDSVFPCPPQV